MTLVASPKRRRSRRAASVHKPRGVLHSRVQKVGPEQFGIVAIDCAKSRSKWMLCNFYGKILVEPTVVTHSRGDFDMAIAWLRRAIADHGLQDVIIAIERTGTYHQPVKRAYAAANFECRIVHPFATKQFRQPANPGNKTDDTDLMAIFLAAVNGFGLMESSLDANMRRLQLLARHRRDLVEKRSAVECQIREHLEAVMPGFAACFDDLWKSQIAMHVARRFASPEAVRKAGVAELARTVRTDGRRCQDKTLDRIVTWAAMAPCPDPAAEVHQTILAALDEDRLAKTREIHGLERELAAPLAKTPYILLLSVPGINVVSAAEFAGEMGPINNYANARAITGRAGLFPSRYQSDAVDHRGSLVRCANRRLRAALLMVAENLRKCNRHFGALADLWKARGKDAGKSHVKIAMRFSRIAYLMVAGGEVFHHPSCLGRDYILDKLMAFHRKHDSSSHEMLTNLQAAANQLPAGERKAEAAPLAKLLAETRVARRRGPQLLGDILPLVLAMLGVSLLQSNASGDQDPS